MNTCFLTSHIGGEYKDLQETACKPQYSSWIWEIAEQSEFLYYIFY